MKGVAEGGSGAPPGGQDERPSGVASWAQRGHFGEAVGFLLSGLGFETARRFGQLMSEVSLEPRHFALLRTIDDDQGRSQNEVGERIRIPPSTMVSVIDHLESVGLVERRAHPTDRRARLLYITPLGNEVLARATQLAISLEEKICEGLDVEERRTLMELLWRVGTNLGLERGVHPATSTSDGPPAWGEGHSVTLSSLGSQESEDGPPGHEPPL